MSEKPVRPLVIVLVGVGVPAAAVGATVLGELVAAGSWLGQALGVAVTVAGVAVLIPLMARGAATVGAGEEAWLANLRFGRVQWLGGKLVLGADAVTFKPLIRIGRERRYPLDSIVAVDSVAGRPPRLRFVLRDGGSAVFSVAPIGPQTWRAPGPDARDEAIREITSRLTTAPER